MIVQHMRIPRAWELSVGGGDAECTFTLNPSATCARLSPQLINSYELQTKLMTDLVSQKK